MRTIPLLGSLALALAGAAAPGAAAARPWQGITPGSSAETDVTARFGQPSTQGKLSGRNAIVYKGDQAVAGTRQVQFFSRDDGVVVEIVVFPANQLDRESVEGTYGKPAQKAFTDDFRPVWFYRASGVSVFFGKDGFVDAISFKPPEADRPPAPRNGARGGAAKGAAPPEAAPAGAR